MQNVHNSKMLAHITFSGWKCLGTKTMCGNFRCKRTDTKKVIALWFRLHLYESNRTKRKFSCDTYARQSAQKVFMLITQQAKHLCYQWI